MKRRALRILLVLAAVVIGSCTANDSDRGNGESRSRRSLPVEVGEPFPYAEPAPPDESTPLDGTYRRSISVDQAGGPPVYCQRCAPWRLDAGEGELVLERGRLYGSFEPISTETPDCRSETLERECKQPPGFDVTAHFRVDGETVKIFNDPNCIGMTGAYRWSLHDGTLVFEEIADECPYVRLRAKYLIAAPWHASG